MERACLSLACLLSASCVTVPQGDVAPSSCAEARATTRTKQDTFVEQCLRLIRVEQGVGGMRGTRYYDPIDTLSGECLKLGEVLEAAIADMEARCPRPLKGE